MQKGVNGDGANAIANLLLLIGNYTPLGDSETLPFILRGTVSVRVSSLRTKTVPRDFGMDCVQQERVFVRIPV